MCHPIQSGFRLLTPRHDLPHEPVNALAMGVLSWLIGQVGVVNGMVAPSQTGIQCAKVGR